MAQYGRCIVLNLEVVPIAHVELMRYLGLMHRVKWQKGDEVKNVTYGVIVCGVP